MYTKCVEEIKPFSKYMKKKFKSAPFNPLGRSKGSHFLFEGGLRVSIPQGYYADVGPKVCRQYDYDG